MPPLTDGPHAGDPPTVLQSDDVVELNRALAQRDARIAELERALREWSELAEHLDLSTQSHRNRTRDLLASTAPEHPDTRRLKDLCMRLRLAPRIDVFLEFRSVPEPCVRWADISGWIDAAMKEAGNAIHEDS